jgi:hypothetical protein
MSTETPLQTKFNNVVTYIQSLDLNEHSLCLLLGNLLIGFLPKELEKLESIIDDKTFPSEDLEDYEKVYMWLEAYPRSLTAISASAGHQLIALSHIVDVAKENQYE